MSNDAKIAALKTAAEEEETTSSRGLESNP